MGPLIKTNLIIIEEKQSIFTISITRKQYDTVSTLTEDVSESLPLCISIVIQLVILHLVTHQVSPHHLTVKIAFLFDPYK